ncbi:MAG: M23 family metallopeptidase [Gemmatimonadetes bacterium]|nr:M23 family metallopeptidase [Gemmatimonadota bacterium]
MAELPHLSLIVVPDGGRESRTYRISYRRLRLLAAAGVVVVIMLTAMVGSWWYFAARTMRVNQLEERLASMHGDEVRLKTLADELSGLEQQYGRIRSLFGTDSAVASDLWLPPSALARSGRSAPPGASEDGRPTSWPLTERGFVTQTVMEGDVGEHSGIDIAVPTDAYIRSAGPGTVVDAGEDRVYGRFIILDHGQGYRSLYAHASSTFVERGQRVRRNEVIALTGSSGRSTAPHLHLEILMNGEPVDPLTLVQQP